MENKLEIWYNLFKEYHMEREENFYFTEGIRWNIKNY